MIEDPLFDWQSSETVDTVRLDVEGGGRRCLAQWWATKPVGVVNDQPTWWMNQFEGQAIPSSCGGSHGWTTFSGGIGAAACVGCPAGLESCPPPPAPSTPPLHPPPPTPPPYAHPSSNPHALSIKPATDRILFRVMCSQLTAADPVRRAPAGHPAGRHGLPCGWTVPQRGWRQPRRPNGDAAHMVRFARRRRCGAALPALPAGVHDGEPRVDALVRQPLSDGLPLLPRSWEHVHEARDVMSRLS